MTIASGGRRHPNFSFAVCVFKMLPIPKWPEVLKFSAMAVITVQLASVFLVWVRYEGFPYFRDIDYIAKISLTLIAVVFGVAAVVVVIDGSFLRKYRQRKRQSRLIERRSTRQEEADERFEARKAQRIANLDGLSGDEIRVIAHCLRDEAQTFYTYVFSPPARMLADKGLVSTPAGSHDRDYHPFSFHDYVWTVLLNRRDEFLKKDDERLRAERRGRG